MWPFKKSAPKSYREWVYLGWSPLKWSDSPDDHVHFYARGENMKDRRVECTTTLISHKYYQRYVKPWLEDKKSNLWNPIVNPSDSLKSHTKDSCGYEFLDSKWAKPAPKIECEGNVIQFNSNLNPNNAQKIDMK